ncbi:MAG: hypothetical protein AAF608_02450 [Pseudomonadota bacterium]
MTQMNTNKPVHTLRDGALKANIWRNESKNGKPYFSVTLTRSYKRSDGTYADSTSFSGFDLTKISRLAESAASHIHVMRDIDRIQMEIRAEAQSEGGAA